MIRRQFGGRQKHTWKATGRCKMNYHIQSKNIATDMTDEPFRMKVYIHTINTSIHQYNQYNQYRYDRRAV